MTRFSFNSHYPEYPVPPTPSRHYLLCVALGPGLGLCPSFLQCSLKYFFKISSLDAGDVTQLSILGAPHHTGGFGMTPPSSGLPLDDGT